MGAGAGRAGRRALVGGGVGAAGRLAWRAFGREPAPAGDADFDVGGLAGGACLDGGRAAGRWAGGR
ncbi:MAG: hypothetical protein HQ582_20040 [Planctomycetes bacterium]|nr:hypothetical protein [Planctomycetota bacterium]